MRLLSSAALLAITAAPPVLAQDYQPQVIRDLKIQYMAHSKLAPIPLKVGSTSPHLKARFEPTGPSNKVYGPQGVYTWYFQVMDFPKNAGGKGKGGNKPTTGAKGTAAATATAVHPMAAKNFEDWARNKDQQNERKWFLEGKKMKGRGKSQPSFKLWEWADVHGQQVQVGNLWWYTLAAVYDLGDREVALVATVPAWKKARPIQKYAKICQIMARSLQTIEVDETSGGRNTAAKEKFADTPFKQGELAKAKKNIEDLPNWDYFTSKNYIILYSWNHKKKGKQIESYKFSQKMAFLLEQCRDQYKSAFPPHDNMQDMYSILRICWTREDFEKYGETQLGVVGWFSPATKELVIFNDTERIYGNEEDTISTLFHEGWHQYGNQFFGPKAELHRWFGEGMGDYFGSFRKKGRSWKYTVDKGRKMSIRSQTARGTYIPLNEIVTWNKDKFYGPRAVDHYAQGYALVDFLQRGKRRLGSLWNDDWDKVLPTYIDVMLTTKKQKKAVEAAFADVDWEKMEEAWLLWVKKFMK